MKAILVNEDKSLRWDDVPDPVIKSDEVLVEEYLKGKIKYDDIASTLAKVYAKFKKVGNVELEDILGIDEQARKYTYSVIGIRC